MNNPNGIKLGVRGPQFLTSIELSRANVKERLSDHTLRSPRKLFESINIKQSIDGKISGDWQRIVLQKREERIGMVN